MRLILASFCLAGACACTQAAELSSTLMPEPAPPSAPVSRPTPAPASEPVPVPEPASEIAGPTRVSSAVDATRLKQNSGITLQWIGWEDRGPALVFEDPEGSYRLSGQQSGADGGRLAVYGAITEIGPGYFVLDGTIEITGTPDADRQCKADRLWRFEVTQGRKYYRMRTFEWCDYLTDYIDIYF